MLNSVRFGAIYRLTAQGKPIQDASDGFKAFKRFERQNPGAKFLPVSDKNNKLVAIYAITDPEKTQVQQELKRLHRLHNIDHYRYDEVKQELNDDLQSKSLDLEA